MNKINNDAASFKVRTVFHARYFKRSAHVYPNSTCARNIISVLEVLIFLDPACNN